MSDGKKFYCFCGSNCKYETMNKEQILAAIAQAAESGLIFDPDASVISKVKEANAGGDVRFWVGTQAQYNALAEKDAYCVYIITDSTKDADIAAAFQRLTDACAAAEQAAANKVPTGYGFAEKLVYTKSLSDLNDTTTLTGYYSYGIWTENLPASNFGGGFVYVENYDGEIIYQTIHNNSPALVYKRRYYDGEWSAWENATVTYTLSKNDAGDIVLTGSDGSVSEVTDETGSGETDGMKMLINETPNADTYQDSNTLWRFAIVELTDSSKSYVLSVLTPYHLLGFVYAGVGWNGENIYVNMSRASGKTKWTVGNVTNSSGTTNYVISRIRAYR